MLRFPPYYSDAERERDGVKSVASVFARGAFMLPKVRSCAGSKIEVACDSSPGRATFVTVISRKGSGILSSIGRSFIDLLFLFLESFPL